MNFVHPFVEISSAVALSNILCLAYLGIYLSSSLIIFFALVDINLRNNNIVAALKACYYVKNSLSAIGLSVLFLMGIPPFSGFILKFNMFSLFCFKNNFFFSVFFFINIVLMTFFYLQLLKLIKSFKPTRADLNPSMLFGKKQKKNAYNSNNIKIQLVFFNIFFIVFFKDFVLALALVF